MPIFQARINDRKGVSIDALPPEAWSSLLGMSIDAASIVRHYKIVPWLNRGVDIRADALTATPIALFRRADNERVSNPEDLPGLSWWEDLPELINGMEADRTLYGAAYLFIERNRLGMVTGLRRLQPTTIRPKATQAGGLTHFVRTFKDGREIVIDPDDLVYSWVPNREAEVGPGSPDSVAALTAAGVLRSVDDYTVAYFERGAVKNLLIDVEDMSVPDAERTRLEKWIQRRMTGLKNAWGVNVGKRKLNIHELGQDPGDLTLPELTNSKREDVATGIAVPQSLLFSNAANFATAQADQLSFYDNTIRPEGRAIAAALNKQLFADLGYRFRFLWKQLEVYQALELRKADAVSRVYRSGVITLDEARETLDYEPLTATQARDLPDVEEVLAQTAIAPTAADSELDAPVSVRGVALEKWHRKAKKRIKEGKPSKALEFTTDALPAALKAAIVGQLEAVSVTGDVDRIFSAALSAYPGGMYP